MRRILFIVALGITLGALAKDKLLRLNLELDTGVMAATWVCDEYQTLPFEGGTGVTNMQLAAYISDEARAAGKAIVARRHVTIKGVREMKWFADMEDALMPLAMADPLFTGATLEESE